MKYNISPEKTRIINTNSFRHMLRQNDPAFDGKKYPYAKHISPNGHVYLKSDVTSKLRCER